MTPSPVVPPRRSLRIRLLLASVIIEATMLTLLVANGVRLINQHLIRNTIVRIQVQEASYNIVLAGFLASRDYSALQSVLDGWGANDSVTYMIVMDHTASRVVAATGHPAGGESLPPTDKVPSPQAKVYNGEFDVDFLGHHYGHVHYGIDTTFLAVARNEMLNQSISIAATEILLTVALLATIGYWLTRHLGLLTRASLKVARGDFSLKIEVKRDDEVGLLSQAFNSMSSAVRSRVQELEDSQERFRAIADYTYSWENWFGTDGRLRWVNPAVQRISGYSPEECIALADFPLPLIAPDDRGTVKSHLEAALAGESAKDIEFRVVRRDGETIWVAMSWQPICDRAGRALGVRASIRDVTDQKRSINMMIDAKNELERLLFAASHDLQEPVRQVHTYTQVLERQLGEGMPNAASNSLGLIRQGADQLRSLVNGLVDFSRSGRSMANFDVVDCRSVIDSAIKQCASCTEGATIEIGELPTVFGDASLLLILFGNLLNNALKFRRPEVPVVVRISSSAEAGGWRIDIADNGIGMEDVDLQTIIRPFSRVYSRSRFPGAGLGLASATKVAALHGGRLWLKSVLGQGTTAHVWLPAFSR